MVKHRKMKGGDFLDSLRTFASNTWNSTKKASTDAYNYATTDLQRQPSNNQTYTPSTTTTYGGRKRSRKMRGGYTDNISLTGLAANASPISNIKSAQPLTIVGGKRRKTRRRHGKTHKRKRH